MDWITHEEDVWFEFRGDRPDQLEPGRYYKGTVDGFADFGVFVDLSPGVTGLLHRSELDRRLESLDWEAGDTVFVQVKNIRDNGNVDLAWSKRQRGSEFRGARIHAPGSEEDGDPIRDDSEADRPVRQTPMGRSGRRSATDGPQRSSDAEDDSATGQSANADAAETPSRDGGSQSPAADSTRDATDRDEPGIEASADAEPERDADAAAGSEQSEAVSASERTGSESESASAAADLEDRERVPISELGDRVGDVVRIEGRVVGVRQTGGPTVFELRDESGVVDCAAFVEPGVRAYPEVEVDDAVRLEGEVELRRNELQVETEALRRLEDEEARAVEDRLAQALTDRARPDEVTPLVPHEPVEAVGDRLRDAAEAIRRAILESRPIVVRHTATADGYVAGAALERAVLPFIREEYARSDAEYHYFVRRPLEEAVYGMDAATNDVTQMLQNQDRHDEKLPLVVLIGVGSTNESRDGLGLLGVYGASRVVVDTGMADEEIEEDTEVLVNPGIEGVASADLSTGALGANLAAAVNEDVREDLRHLPAVSYWEGTPQAYVDLAAEAGYDESQTRHLREAVALEAYYQSYEDKRELITDILFDDSGGLAEHIAEQFTLKMNDEVETAEANVERRTVEGTDVVLLDADSYTHRFDFPPTTLLVDELHRRNRTDGPVVTVGVKTDELFVRTTEDLDVREIAERAREAVPEGGIAVAGVREGRIEFLSGARDRVVDAVVDAAAELA
jgi:RecJ-like exonuclease